MPTIRVVDDNVIEFVDSNGDVAAREGYDEAASEVSFVDGDGNPMPVSLGDATAESVSTGDATITDATVSNFTDSPTGTYGKTIAAPTPTAYFSGPAHGEGINAFFGATLAPDGRVIFAPRASSNVGIVSQLLDIATANTANR